VPHLDVVLPFSCLGIAPTSFQTLISRCRFLVLAFFSASLLLLVAQGQSLPPPTSSAFTGEQPYQSYHGGDIDSINLSNGRLALNFPLLSYPQRGSLHLSFNLMYNNEPQHYWAQVEPKLPVLYFWGGGPLVSTLPLENGDVFVGWAEQLGVVLQTISKTVGTNTYQYPLFNIITADGTEHVLGNLGSDSNCVQNGFDSLNQTGPWESLDATGWSLNGGAVNYCTGSYPTTVTDPAGVRHLLGEDLLPSIGDEDPNGNEITLASSTMTDSVGRQITLPPNINSASNTSTGNCPVVGGVSAAHAVSWSVPAYNGQNATYTFCYASIAYTYPSIAGPGGSTPGGGGTATKLQSIVLPDGQSWQFQYNDVVAGLTQITLPTGGTISYTYTTENPTSCSIQPSLSGRWVASRTVNANDGTGAHTWTYTYNLSSSSAVVTDPLGNDVVHTFGYNVGCVAYETQTQYYQGSHTSGTLLKTVNTSYSGSVESSNTAPYLGINVVPVSVSTVWPNGQTSTVTKSYDSGFNFVNYEGNVTANGIYGKVVTETESDYGNGGAGPILRTTNTNWQALSGTNAAFYLANNLLSLPYSVQVENRSGTQQAYTYYGYDESSLQSSGITEQHVAGESYPGNQTSVHRWLNGTTVSQTPCSVSVSNGYLVSNNIYYDTGEVQQSTDPCSYPTSYLYSPTYYGAFLTTVTNALTQSTTYSYDFDTGAVTSITDPNSQTTTKAYDILTRLTKVNYPDGGSTSYCYTDLGGSTCTQASAPFVVVVTTAITASPVNETLTAVFDGLGRTSQTQLNSDPSGVAYTLTTYDGNGRKYQVYNPTRCAAITANCGESTWGYTTTNYDPLNRIKSVIEQDGSTISTNYSAFPCTIVTDEAGNARESCVDGLGRMTSVIEDPGSSPHLNYQTTYTYDALSDLTNVVQNGSDSAYARTRSFVYDSLSRLTSATNFESGKITYAYDADSNVISKIAPSPNQPSTGTATVATTYTYDALNRLTGKGYSDSYTQNPATPAATYGYDGANLSCPTPTGLSGSWAHNGIGRRTAMCYGAGNESWAYDPMGRISGESDRVIGLVPPYAADVYDFDGVQTIEVNISYSYYLNGDLAEYLYPSGIKTYEFSTIDNAAGEVVQAFDIYDSNVKKATFTPDGQLASEIVGSSVTYNGTTLSNTYNSRLQPVLRSATSASSAEILNLTYSFNWGNGDNGNVIQIANGKDSNRTQNFTYDHLNRIQQAYTNGSNWGETYGPVATSPGVAPSTPGIDAWGNLTNRSGVTGKTSYEPLNCAPANTANQLNACYTYDAAGNLIQSGTSTYTYDAENRLIATGGDSYIYDGDGQRIEKCTAGTTPGTCAVGATGTFYWKQADKTTLAESDLGGNWTAAYGLIRGQIASRVDLPSDVVHYYFQDHLRSTSIVTDCCGNILNESDYYPYGGEIVISDSDSNHYKFTGKERDSESGLDNFDFRYYASTMGRFMKPDDPLVFWDQSNPQSLNLYEYALNNPTSNTDDDGHSVTICDTNGHCNTVDDDAYAADQQADKNNIAPSLSNLANSSTGTGAITNSSGDVVGTVQWTPDNPGIQTLGLAGQMAAPGVNFAAQGLRMFGYAFAAPVMVAAECLAGAPSCTKGNVAMAMLPEVGALREGTLLLKEGAAFGKGAEILQKAGGLEQAAKDFESLQGTESVYGSARVKTLSDGSKAVLYQSTGGSGATTIAIQNAAGRTVTKIRY
jgi:RHS repeat-associated protein